MKNYILLFCFMMAAGMVSAQALKVAANGNVGVGIANPATSLDVADDARIRGNVLEVGRSAGSTTAQLKVGFGRSADGTASFDLIGDAAANPSFGFRFQRFSNGQTTMIHKGTRDFIVRNDDLADFSVWTAGTKRFVIEDTGDVGIGIGNPTAKLHVSGTVFATDYDSPSDLRLKKILKSDNLPGLEEVMKMNVVKYQYNGEAGITSNDAHIGIIAQELKAIAPQMVGEFDYIAEDEDGNVVSENTYLSVKDSEIKYMLVNAIQEQQKLIESLQSQIAELQATVVQNATVNDTNVQLVDSKQSTLSQNSPNPYNEGTVIKYEVAENATVAKMNFYNLSGQLIKTVSLQNGAGQLNVSADELPSGTYTYSLEVDGTIISNKKMVKMR